jgi:hypothetical protein
MRAEQLFEDIFLTDRMSAFEAIRQHPNLFVHFSSGITRDGQRSPSAPKFGINPSKTHGDPPGIYFYYNRWLLKSDDVSDGQYGVHGSEYFWVCNITKTSNSLNIGAMKKEDAIRLAKRNGWEDEYYDCIRKGNVLTSSQTAKAAKTVGGQFWGIMDYLVNEAKTHSWLKLLRGVDAIFDSGLGIINYQEPAQVIVLNKALIKIVTFGTNRDKQGNVVARTVKAFSDKIGGRFSFKYKRAIIDFEIDGAPVQWSFDDYGRKSTSQFKEGFWVTDTEPRSMASQDANWFGEGLMKSYEALKRYGKLEKTGTVSEWSPQSAVEFSKQLFTKALLYNRTNVKDGVLIITGDNTGVLSSYNRIEVNHDGSVMFLIDFYKRGGVEVCKAEATFPAKTPRSHIVAELRKQLISSANQAVEKKEVVSLEKLAAVTGLILS